MDIRRRTFAAVVFQSHIRPARSPLLYCRCETANLKGTARQNRTRSLPSPEICGIPPLNCVFHHTRT